MKVLDLKKGDKIAYMKDEMMPGAYNKGQISIIHSVDLMNNHVSIGKGVYGVPLNGLCDNYKFVNEDESLDNITLGLLDLKDFLLQSKSIGMMAYKIGCGEEVDDTISIDGLTLLGERLMFNICFPEFTPEDIFKKDMSINHSDFEKYDESILTFLKLPKEVSDNYIINDIIYKNCTSLWSKIYITKISINKIDFIIEALFTIDNCYKLGLGKEYKKEPTDELLQVLNETVMIHLNKQDNNFYTLMYKKLENLWDMLFLD